jgi:hypothetical protein
VHLFQGDAQGILCQATSAIWSVQLCSTWAEQAQVAILSVTEGEDKPLKISAHVPRKQHQDHQQDRPAASRLRYSQGDQKRLGRQGEHH